MRVLLVDDHPAILLGLGTLLSTAEDIEVVGEAAGIEQALRLAEKLQPALVVLDLQMEGGLGGLRICRGLKALEAPPRVLFYTGHHSNDHVAQAVLAGADGYFYKGISQAKLTEALRSISEGERVWMVEVEPEDASHLGEVSEGARLTPKESEVLALVLKRHTNAEVARKLFIGLPTVKSHLSSILRKLGVRRREELFRGTSVSKHPAHTKGRRSG